MSFDVDQINRYVPLSELQRRGFTYDSVFVQGAWRRMLLGLPEGYVPMPYPKWQYHPMLTAYIVWTEAEHHELFASDDQWSEPPSSDLLSRFLKELS